MRTNQKLLAIPKKYFLCPITNKLLQDPVILLDGNSYSRSAIDQTNNCNRVYAVNTLLKNILQRASFAKDNEGNEYLVIDQELLINPRTGFFYRHPVVDGLGNTVEAAEKNSLPENKLIQRLIASVTTPIKAAASAQEGAAQPETIPQRKSFSGDAQRKSYTEHTALLATPQTVSAPVAINASLNLADAQRVWQELVRNEEKQVEQVPSQYLVTDDYFNEHFHDAIDPPTRFDKAVIAEDGMTYEEKYIKAWMSSGRLNALLSPLTQQPIGKLRDNNLMSQISNAQEVLAAESLSVLHLLDFSRLINPKTGKCYFYPVVDKDGNTKDGDQHGHYFNFYIKHVIDDFCKVFPQYTPDKLPGDQIYYEQRAEGEGEQKEEPPRPQQQLILIENEHEHALNHAPPANWEQFRQNLAQVNADREVINLRERLRRIRIRFERARQLIGLIGVGSLTYIIYLMVRKNSSPSSHVSGPPITWSMKIPYVPGDEFCIHNHQKGSLQINQIQFAQNVQILDMWGDLFTYGSTFTSTFNSQINAFVNLLTLNGVSIPAGQMSCATYNYNVSTVQGPIPQYVGIALQEDGIDVWLNGQKIPYEGSGNPLNPVSDYIVGGWFPNWAMYARNYTAAKIPFKSLQQVYAAFIGLNATTGNLFSQDSYADNWQFPTLAAQRYITPDFKVLAGIGGYCTGAQFNQATSDPVILAKLVANLVAARKQLQVDGWMINPEWWGEARCTVTPNASGYVELLRLLRIADPTGIYAMTAPASKAAMEAFGAQNWCLVNQYADYIHVEGIDYGGAFDTLSDFLAPLQTDPRDKSNIGSVANTIQNYLQLGCLDRSKILLQNGAYGRSMFVASTETQMGLWQPVTGTPIGQYDKTGTFDYACIATKQCHGFNSLPSGALFVGTNNNSFANYSRSPWVYVPNSNFVLTCEDPTSIQDKMAYVRQQGLGGATIWDLSQDASPDSGISLTSAMVDGLNVNDEEEKASPMDARELQTSGSTARFSSSPYLLFASHIKSGARILADNLYGSFSRLVDAATKKAFDVVKDCPSYFPEQSLDPNKPNYYGDSSTGGSAESLGGEPRSAIPAPGRGLISR